MSNLFGDSWFLLNDTVSLRWMLTLLHFLWQGAVIGVVVVVVAKLLRHMSASLRYGLYLFALLSLPCCVALTFCVINVPERVTTAAPVPPAMLAGVVPAETVVLPESPVVIPPMIALPEVPQGNVPASPIMATAPPISMREDKAPAEPQWITLLSLFAPWITACYAIGVFGFLLRLSIALWGGHRLRASANRLTDSRLLELIATEARQVGLRFVPVVAYCERVAVPTVVGILRPMVLLPASIITGLTSEEFAAIIGHEFAHIRRYDLWVNLLQRVIESLLFFHPVVWFLSRRLSAERELCCDDLVVRSGCAPMNYAGALLRMAELCAASRPTNAAALAADGDEPSLLEHRIQRLMNTDKAPRLQLTRAGLLALMLTLALLVAVPPAVRNWAQADEPSTPAAQVDKTLPKDSNAEQVDKDVKGEVTISGRIVMENGSPATKKGWMYYICRNENGSYNGTADEYSGTFSLKCPKGTVWLIHFPDDYAPTWAGPFDLKTQSELNDVKLVLKPGTSRRVRITNEDGQPIAGATLVVHPVVTNIGTVGPVREQATDENGEVLLEHLADIEYKLRCSAPGYQTLRTEPLAINGDEPLLQTLERSESTTGIVVNADNSPAAGARLLACAEVFEGGSANSMAGSGDGFWFGTEFAKTDSEGRFSMNQLSSGSHYLFVIETTDHARAIVHSIEAGQKDLKFTIPQRLDLRVNIVGDTSKLPQRNGQPFFGVRQRINLRPERQSIYGGLIGADASIEGTETSSTAIFRGLAVDLHPSPEKQRVEVSLGYSNELKKTVEMNLSGATEVEFILPGNQAAAKSAEVETKYPHCIVNVENLKSRSLANAVAAFNLEAQESPVGVFQQPITEKETLDAIAASLNDARVTDAFKAVLRDIAESKQLPSNVYFRRFTRLDNEQKMHEVWWVRLVVESEAGPVYSVPVRTTALKSRPYTQMERQQNASGGLTLINRFVSYFAEPPNILLAKEFPKDAVDRLVNSAETSIKAKNTETFQSLFDWNGASDATRAFVKSEFAMLADSTIHSVKVSPRDFRGELVHWSAYQHYQPNLEIVGYLDIEYSNTDQRVDRRRTLSLEMGQVGNELRLVNYVPKGERNLPQGKIEGLSIRGHIEPLADGTYLETTIITNPGTLLSGHVANEEVRQRDPKNSSPEDELEPEANNDPAPNIHPAHNQQPAAMAELTDAQRRELLLKAVAEADLIPDEQARMKAQWDLVSYLINAGLHDEAFQQAMKLRTANPQMCIYSLKTIAVDAVNRGDQATVSKAWDAAKKSNADSGTKFNHYVVQLGFQLNQPVSEMLAIAAAAKRDDQRRAYQDVRNELTWRGRIDEAYVVTNAYLSDLPKDFNDREMAYYCSSARSYDYNLKHDHIGQAIRIIEQMAKGEHRDAAISQLIDGLLYVANKDQVPEERLALAEAWVGRIDDPIKQATSKAAILRRRLPGTNVEELERQFAAIDSREEKLTILRNIFQKLLEEGRIEEADLILPREVQLIKDQPRPEQKSKFGNVNDEDGIRMTTWTRSAAIVRALHKAGHIDEAKARLEAMKNLPDSEPFFMVGNLAGIRLQLYKELEDFDAVEKHYADASDPISKFSMAAWMMQKGQFDRGWTHVTPFLETPSETMFPPEVRQKNLYFVAQPFENLARELFKANRPDDALKIISKLPESRDTAHAFETFGELLVSNGHVAELEQWIARLPHETARTHTRLGALREMTKTK